MPTYKVVWKFIEQTGGTFNEVYYTDEANPDAASAITTEELFTRLDLLYNNNTFVSIAAANTANPRDNSINLIGQRGTQGSVAGPLGPGWAVVCNLVAPGAQVRKLWLRGCPATFFKKSGDSGLDDPPAVLLTRLSAFFKTLRQGGWGTRRLTPKTTAVNDPHTPVNINSVDGTAANGTSKVLLNGPLLVLAGDRVVIGGASKKDLPSLNGHFTVLNVVANTITIPYTTPGQAVVVGGGGYMRKETYSNTIVFNDKKCKFAYYGQHSTKNPLSSSRGARRAARLRLSR